MSASADTKRVWRTGSDPTRAMRMTRSGAGAGAGAVAK